MAAILQSLKAEVGADGKPNVTGVPVQIKKNQDRLDYLNDALKNPIVDPTGTYAGGFQDRGKDGKLLNQDAALKERDEFQAQLTTLTQLSEAYPDWMRSLRESQIEIRKTTAATQPLNVQLGLTKEQLDKWPQQLTTRLDYAHIDQTRDALLSIADAAHQAGFPNIGMGQATAIATVMVKSDPSIAHTKENIDAVARALLGISDPPPVQITANADPLWSVLYGLPGIGGNAPMRMDLSLGGLVPQDDASKPHHALGTIDAPGGWTKVGENGPEWVRMPRHAQVRNNAQSAWMDRQLGGAGSGITNVEMRQALREHGEHIARVMASYAHGAGQSVIAAELNYQEGY